MLSIIISAKNEEPNIPILLKSIKEQRGINPGELEIILSDGGSIDRTMEIARKHGCVVVQDGYPGQRRHGNPAIGRNYGAKYSRGNILLFKDGDSPLPHPHFLELALKEFEERGLDVAGTLQSAYTSKGGFAKLRYKAYMEFFTNLSMRMSENTNNPLMMTCMFARKGSHDLIGGFDQNLEFGEENEYARRAKTAGAKFGILKLCGKVGYNMRRFEEHELKMLFKNVYFVTKQRVGKESRRKEKAKIKYWE